MTNNAAPLQVVAIIVAGGQGLRMGSALPKQFLPLKGKPILYHTIKAFLDAVENIGIVLVLPEEHISYSNMVLQAFDQRIDLTIVAGGNTRYQSVANGLAQAVGSDVVMIHDGVRPLVDAAMIQRCLHMALEKGSAIPVIPVNDSIRQVSREGHHAVDRSTLRAIQTPQTFRTDLILEAFQQPYQEQFTDEATVLETFGMEVHLTEGSRSNIKITTPEDLAIAEVLMKDR